MNLQSNYSSSCNIGCFRLDSDVIFFLPKTYHFFHVSSVLKAPDNIVSLSNKHTSYMIYYTEHIRWKAKICKKSCIQRFKSNEILKLLDSWPLKTYLFSRGMANNFLLKSLSCIYKYTLMINKKQVFKKPREI